MVVAQFILSYCSCVTKIIQAVNCDLGKAYKDVHVSKESIANARNETTSNKVWGRIESIAEADLFKKIKLEVSELKLNKGI